MNENNIPTPHITARPEEIAKTVLMPGDPLRAKNMAERFLEDAHCFNEVRGMLGFTGTYKGKRISIMGSGMGMASIGIYSYELYKFYDVDNIIRVGTCGAFVKELSVNDVLLVDAAYSESTYAKVQTGTNSKKNMPSPELNKTIVQTADQLGISLKKEYVLSKDVYYNLQEDYYRKMMNEVGVKATEMEAFALFANAQATKKHAACILTVVGNLEVQDETTTPEQREKACIDMITLSVEAAAKL